MTHSCKGRAICCFAITFVLVYLIISLIILGRISGHILTYLGFSLYISNTTDRLQGIQCFKDANFTPDTMPSVFNITCPVHGQYVIYYNERVPGFVYPYGYQRSVEADLCEVEVYGTCSLCSCNREKIVEKKQSNDNKIFRWKGTF